METTTIPPSAPPAARARPLAAVRRYAGRWGLIAALAALPVYYGIHDLTVGYQAGVVAGHAVIRHDLSNLGFNFAVGLSNGAVQITKDVHSAIPTAKVFGGDGVCTDSYTNATKGGIPAALYPLTECTVATQDLAAYPGGKAFLAAYKAKYGVSDPDPYAIYGYEVMNLGLDTIRKLGAQGDSKSAILKALFAIKARPSVLGTYGFDKNGDTTLKSYGLYKVGSDGEPVFVKTLTPTQTVG